MIIMLQYEAHQENAKRSRVELDLVVIAVRRKHRPHNKPYICIAGSCILSTRAHRHRELIRAFGGSPGPAYAWSPAISRIRDQHRSHPVVALKCGQRRFILHRNKRELHQIYASTT